MPFVCSLSTGRTSESEALMFSHFHCIQIFCSTTQPTPRHSKVRPNIHHIFFVVLKTMRHLNWSATFSWIFNHYNIFAIGKLFSCCAGGRLWHSRFHTTKIDIWQTWHFAAADHRESTNAEMDIFPLEMCLWIFGRLDHRRRRATSTHSHECVWAGVCVLDSQFSLRIRNTKCESIPNECRDDDPHCSCLCEIENIIVRFWVSYGIGWPLNDLICSILLSFAVRVTQNELELHAAKSMAHAARSVGTRSSFENNR